MGVKITELPTTTLSFLILLLSLSNTSSLWAKEVSPPNLPAANPCMSPDTYPNPENAPFAALGAALKSTLPVVRLSESANPPDGAERPDDAWFLSAARPDAGDPGHCEIESTSSGAFSKNTQRLAGPATQLNCTPRLPQWGNPVQLQLEFDGYVNQSGSATNAPVTSGFGNLSVGVLTHLADFAHSGTQVGAALNLSTPTNSYATRKGLSNPRTTATLTFLLEQELGPNTSLFVNVGKSVRSDGNGPWLISADFAHKLNDTFTVYFGAVSAFSDPGKSGDQVALETGVTIQIRDQLRLGAGIQRTISSSGGYSNNSTAVLLGLKQGF